MKYGCGYRKTLKRLFIKSRTILFFAGQGNTPELILPIAFAGIQITENSLSCSVDTGYPSTNLVLKVQTKANSDPDFVDFVEVQASEQCEIDETKATKSYIAFQLSDDQLEFRCVVFDRVENEILVQSNTMTLDVYESKTYNLLTLIYIFRSINNIVSYSRIAIRNKEHMI